MSHLKNTRIEDILRGVFTLEQGEAKKIFSALRKGVRKAEAQDLIPRGTEEILRKTISRLLNEAKENMMNNNDVDFKKKSKEQGTAAHRVSVHEKIEDIKGTRWEQIGFERILELRPLGTYYLMTKDVTKKDSWFYFPNLLPGKDCREMRSVVIENPDESIVSARLAWINLGQSIAVISEEDIRNLGWTEVLEKMGLEEWQVPHLYQM